MASQRSPRTPQAVNVTVNTQSYGVFGLGGKSNMSVKVQPALNRSQKHNPTQTNYLHDTSQNMVTN